MLESPAVAKLFAQTERGPKQRCQNSYYDLQRASHADVTEAIGYFKGLAK